jgi:hypothetical protein
VARILARGVVGALAAAIGSGALHVSTAAADPTRVIPDPPPRRRDPVVGPSPLRPTHDLDGIYTWLGPVGAASHLDASWDSTFGADLSIVRVREGRPLGAIGATAGGSLWTERRGYRLWLDGLVGTRLGGRMYGVSLGPLVELPELIHPRLGGSIGLWAFFGVTPFVRVGVVDRLGAFAEVGLHLSLPVLRW